MKRGLITATTVTKILVLYQIVVKKCIIYQDNIECDITGYKKSIYLAHVKQHLKIVSVIIKFRSTTLNMKMIRNLSKECSKSKSAMEHQNLQGKLSEYVVFTIQTVSVYFNV